MADGQEATNIRELSRQVTDLGNRFTRIESKIDTQNETLTQLKVSVGGFPGLGEGLLGQVSRLQTTHGKLKDDFDEHVSTQATGQAERKGLLSGARLVWVVLFSMLGLLGTILTLILNIDRLIGGAGGG